MRKSNITVLFIILILAVFATTALAATIQVTFNGKTIPMTQTPVIVKSRVLVTIAPIAKEAGAVCIWDGKARKLTIKKGTRTSVVTVGSTYATIGKTAKKLDVPVRLTAGQIMVPSGFTAEALDLNVAWDAKSNTLRYLTKPINMGKPDPKSTTPEDLAPVVIPVEKGKVGVLTDADIARLKQMPFEYGVQTGRGFGDAYNLNPAFAEKWFPFLKDIINSRWTYDYRTIDRELFLKVIEKMYGPEKDNANMTTYDAEGNKYRGMRNCVNATIDKQIIKQKEIIQTVFVSRADLIYDSLYSGMAIRGVEYIKVTSSTDPKMKPYLGKWYRVDRDYFFGYLGDWMPTIWNYERRSKEYNRTQIIEE